MPSWQRAKTKEKETVIYLRVQPAGLETKFSQVSFATKKQKPKKKNNNSTRTPTLFPPWHCSKKFKVSS